MLSDSLRVEAQGKIKVTTVKPGNRRPRNQSRQRCRQRGCGHRHHRTQAAQFFENAGNLLNGALRPEQAGRGLGAVLADHSR